MMDSIGELQQQSKNLEKELMGLVDNRDWRMVAEIANELRYVDSRLSYFTKQVAEDQLNDWPHKIEAFFRPQS